VKTAGSDARDKPAIARSFDVWRVRTEKHGSGACYDRGVSDLSTFAAPMCEIVAQHPQNWYGESMGLSTIRDMPFHTPAQ